MPLEAIPRFPAGGSKLARTIGYLTSEKKYLVRFLESPDVPIDNNRAENAIRPFCVGRKNWLFSASVKGAKASAILYSLAATACANGLNVEEYFTRLFQSRPGLLFVPFFDKIPENRNRASWKLNF